jgi:hypothetical protein
MTGLPRRTSRLWLPSLGKMLSDEELVYHVGAVGPRGVARLRVWEAGDAAEHGRFAVVTDLGRGMPVSDAQSGLWRMLASRLGQPFAMAEQWPEGRKGSAHVDLVLPPGPDGPEWLRIWPVTGDHPLREYVTAWWSVNGDAVLSL